MKYQLEMTLEIRQLDNDGRVMYNNSFRLSDTVPLGEKSLAEMLPIMAALHDVLKQFGDNEGKK